MNSKANTSALIGVPKYFDVEVISRRVSEQTLVDSTIGAGNTCRLLNLFFKSVFPCEWKATIDDVVIASGFAGPGYPKDFHYWSAGRDVIATENLKVLATVANGFVIDKIGVHIEARNF